MGGLPPNQGRRRNVERTYINTSSNKDEHDSTTNVISPVPQSTRVSQNSTYMSSETNKPSQNNDTIPQSSRHTRNITYISPEPKNSSQNNTTAPQSSRSSQISTYIQSEPEKSSLSPILYKNSKTSHSPKYVSSEVKTRDTQQSTSTNYSKKLSPQKNIRYSPYKQSFNNINNNTRRCSNRSPSPNILKPNSNNNSSYFAVFIIVCIIIIICFIIIMLLLFC